MNDQDKWLQFLQSTRTKHQRDTEMLEGIPGYKDGNEHKFPVIRVLDSKLILPRRVMEALVGQGVVAETTDLGSHILVFDPGTYKFIAPIKLKVT